MDSTYVKGVNIKIHNPTLSVIDELTIEDSISLVSYEVS